MRLGVFSLFISYYISLFLLLADHFNSLLIVVHQRWFTANVLINCTYHCIISCAVTSKSCGIVQLQFPGFVNVLHWFYFTVVTLPPDNEIKDFGT